MSDSTDKIDLISPWHPMTDTVDVKHIGKLIEELGECTAAASRCLIQGINEAEPVTGKINKQWLEEEIADVLANCSLIQTRFELDWNVINSRMNRKIANLRRWHKGA